MNQFMIDFLLQNTIWSILTGSLVVCLALTMRRRPAVIHLACVLALIAMMTPPLFSVAFPGAEWLAGYRSAESGDLESVVMAESESVTRFAAVDSREIQEDQPVTDVSTVAQNPLGVSSEISHEAEAEFFSLLPVPVPLVNWPNTLLLIWAVGSLAYLVFIVRQIRRFRSLITNSQPARKKLGDIIEAESQRMRLRHPIVRELSATISPFVFLSAKGPKLVMPTALIDELSDDELRSLSIHELAHIKRRDPAIRILELIVATVFWFNPALWVIRHQLRRAEELACDAVVADSLKSKPEIYAGAFLKTIDFLATDGIVRPPTMICTVGGYRFCTQRLKAMVNASNHVGVSRVQAIMTATVALPILLAGFMTASDPGNPSHSNNQAAVGRWTSFHTVGVSNVLGEDELTSLDHEILKQLSAVKETPKIIFHYRPGDLDDQSLAKVVKANVEKFEECESLLRMKYKGRVHIFLYRDVADLQKTTGTGAVAFSTGTVSVHQAIEFNSVHEFTHIFALQFPNDEDKVTDNFAVEGLATILAKHDENVPIHSWAAVYQSASRLPNLVELRRSWPGGAPPRVHVYHVAGSFVGYLIEEFGIEKVKRWYVNSTEAHMEFGKTFRRLERDWQQWLKRKTVQPKDREHILAKLGLGVMPEKYASAKKTALFDGKSLSGLATEDKASWSVKNGRLTGTDKSTWSFLATERKFPVNVGVRVKFRLVEGKAVAVMLNRTKDSKSHINFATWSTYLSLTNGGYVPLSHLKLELGQWYEVVVVNENGTARVYLNGLVLYEHEGAFFLNEGTLGVAVEGGTIEVEKFESFEVAAQK